MRVTLLVSSHPAQALALAAAWVRAGDDLTVVLLDAAAALARPGHAQGEAVQALAAAGAVVGAHDDALRRRALPADAVVAGVKVLDLDDVADLVTGGDRTIWW